jgi:NADH-quinone oxidoreductase subunit J
MLMNLNSTTEPQKHLWMKLAGVISGGCLLIMLVSLTRQAIEMGGRTATSDGEIGLIKNLGKVLFSEYVVPFEITSVLFLSAMVGAVVIGKKE